MVPPVADSGMGDESIVYALFLDGIPYYKMFEIMLLLPAGRKMIHPRPTV